MKTLREIAVLVLSFGAIVHPVFSQEHSPPVGQSSIPYKTLQASPTSHEVDCLGFSRNGAMFFAGTLDSWASIWSTDDWHVVTTVRPKPLPKTGIAGKRQKFRLIDACAISPAGDTFALASEGIVSVYSVPSGTKLKEINSPANSVAYSPDGRQLAIGFRNTVQLWDTTSWDKTSTLGVGAGLPAIYSEISALKFSPIGGKVAAGNRSGIVDVLNPGDPSEPRMLRSAEPKPGRIGSLSFSPDGRLLASTISSFQPGSGGASVWSVDTGEQIVKLASSIKDIAFSSDGKNLATVNDKGLVQLWNVSGWKERCHFSAGDSSTVTYSPDSKWLVTGGGTPDLSVWTNPPCQ